MTKPKRFTIIHLGNPYDFVVKDHNTNRTYGTFQGDDDSLEECLNNIADENDQLKKVIEEHKNTLKGQSNSIYQLKKENEFLKRRLEEWV